MIKENPPSYRGVYERCVVLLSSTPDRIRTCDLMLRRHALYPAELRAQLRDI